MARRYSKTLHRHMNKFDGSGIFADPGAAGDYNDAVHRALQPQHQAVAYVAPGRYSNVRKVVFDGVYQWKENNAGFVADMRQAVQIASSSNTGKVAEGVSVALGPTRVLAGASDSIWSFLGNSTKANWPDDWMAQGAGGSPVLGPLAVVNGGDLAPFDISEGDQQHLTTEFDRFDPAAADFFNDWDTIAALGPDFYMGFQVIPSYVIGTPTGGSFTNFALLGTHITVVQAPGPDNRTCTMWPAGDYNVATLTLGGIARQTAYFTFPNAGLWRFPWNVSDWDGVQSISLHTDLDSGIIAAGQSIFHRLLELPDDPTAAAVTLDEFSFNNNTSGAAAKDHYRSADMVPLMTDGRKYGWQMRLEGAGGNPAGLGPLSLEIIQEQCTKTSFIIDFGGAIGDPGANKLPRGYANYWDPLFFEDFEDELILSRQIHCSIFHGAAANLIQVFTRHDAVLDARDDVGHSSVTALSMTGQCSSSGLDNADNPQIRFDIIAIVDNDPLQIAGKRKIYQKTTGATATGAATQDGMRQGSLVYNHTVPETDLPELGPLFPLGAFNPEGCAATSAGLGDNPALLVITNGSTIPKHFNPAVPIVEDNGVPTPFCDEIPSSVVDDTGASPTSGLGLGIYVYRYTLRNCCTLKESDPNPDDIVVDTSGKSPAAKVTLSFAGVRIPGDPQICEICVYRTLLGGDFPVMAKVGCFDPSVSTLFVDDVADAVLDFLNEGLSLLNGPMPCVPVVAEFRNRLFGMGDIPDLSPAGTVSVVNGSDIVTGDEDVEWDRCLEGKFIQVQGDCRSYEIDKVLPPAAGLSPPIGRLKLTDEYEGSDDTSLLYTICGRPNRLYISEPLEPECWPAANFLDVEPGDGDRLMGAVSNFNRLVICKRNKTYVLTFNEQPAIEVVVPTRISSDIGCIGPRTFAQIGSGSVWLSDRGIVVYDGRSVHHVPESDQMNNMFVDSDNPRYVRRDANGRVIGAVGVFYPKREQYLLLLPTVQTVRGANLMLVWDVELKNITLLEFCQEFQSMVVAKDSDGNERVYLGDTNGFVWIYDVGDNDGVGFPNAVGTVTGTVSNAGVELVSGASFLDDETATFLTGGLPGLAGLSGIAGLSGAVLSGDLGMAGACIFTRAAGAGLDDPWQVRTVFASTENRIYVTPSWGTETPSVGDDYMIGAIRFSALFKPSNYGTDDYLKRDWRQVVTHRPESVASRLRIELLPDFMNSDPEELTILDDSDPPEPGKGRIFDLSFNKGRQVAPVGRLIHNYQAVRMSNFAPEQPIRVINHALMVTPKQSR